MSRGGVAAAPFGSSVSVVRLSRSNLRQLHALAGLPDGPIDLPTPGCCELCVCVKRTNIVLNQKLVREGLKSTGLKTRRALVEHALQELVRRERQAGLLALKGKVRWEGDLDAMRKTRTA